MAASTPDSRRWSYSASLGLAGRARELAALVRLARRGPAPHVARCLRNYEQTCQRIEQRFGRRPEGCHVLEIGPGQLQPYLRLFSLRNRAVGVDTDVLALRGTLDEYLRMVRLNSPARALKTLFRRQVFGVDRRFERALAQAAGVEGFAPPQVLREDATRLPFADASFDLVCSYSVFEHIERPAAALAEVRRVLAPGGVAYLSLHLYTSHSGGHDLASLARPHPAPPYWPHLRGRVVADTFLNRLRLADWRRLFAEELPGAELVLEAQEELRAPLRALRAAGELQGFSDEELLTLNVVALWRKG